MSVLAPVGVPAGFTVEPATGAHAPEVFAVVAAELTEAFGFCPDTEEDVRAELEPPQEVQTLGQIVRDPDGSVVQWWAALTDPGDPLFHTWVFSHPRLPAEVHDVLAAAGWSTLVEWIRGQAQPGNGPIRVHSGCPAPSQAGHRRLEAAGFTHKRTFWEMVGPVTDSARIAPEVPALTITAHADTRALHAVLNTGFEGHWGFSPMDYDDWMAVQPTLAGSDPSLWFLAEVDGVPAAGMIMSRRVQSDGAMYVQELATLDEFRRRGIASALLALAFEQAAKAGLDRLSLHVDSENSHDAPGLYRRAGLTVRCAFHGHVCDLPR